MDVGWALAADARRSASTDSETMDSLMAKSRKRVIALTAVGLLYGSVLASFGLGVANGGDGAMIPLYVFGSPLFIPLLFLAPVVWWPTVALILSGAREAGFRKSFLAMMAAHYLGLVPYLIAWGDWGNLSRAWARSPAPLVIMFGWYLAGHAAFWIEFLTVAPALQPATDA